MKKYITAFSFLLIIQAVPAQRINKRSWVQTDSLLRTVYADSLPGIAVGILQKGSPPFEKSYGISSTESKEKITSLTNFNIASLTKQFTAMAVLQLEEQGRLSLSDKLNRFFPHMNPKVADNINLQQLLTHTSGIPDHYGFIDTKGMKHAHNKDVYEAIKNVDSLYFPPGTQFRYSNTGYCLLALVIEKASGLSYNEYMQKNIFAKAGMSHTLIWNEQINSKHSATGYDKDSTTGTFIPSGAEEHIFFSTEGDGGVYTSIHDYLLWIKALNEGKVFTKAMVDKARSIEYVIDAKQKLGYGFGWFADESKSDKKVYHSGDNGGFRTYSFTLPDQDFAIVIFSNRSDIAVEDIVEKIYHLIYPNRTPFIKVEVLTS